MASGEDTRWSALSHKVDEVFVSIDRKNSPGCAVGVINDGYYIHRAGYGMANLEHQIPIDTNSVFRMGSLSKQFTAMAVALAAEDGYVDLDSDIHNYLSELPNYGCPVTVRHLIGHVGGMGDYRDLEGYLSNAVGKRFRFGNQDYVSADELFSILTNVPMMYEPGQDFKYSNLGYFILSQIISRATGQTLKHYAQKKIFEPLGMKRSFFNDDLNGIVPHRVSGYKTLECGYETFDTNLELVGGDGVYTSIDDFLAWDQNFYEPKLGKEPKTLIDLTTRPVTDKTFPKSDTRSRFGFPKNDTRYGFGQMIGTYNNEPMISHRGEWVGFHSFYARFPRLKFSVVAFSNDNSHHAADYVKSILDIYWTIIKRND